MIFFSHFLPRAPKAVYINPVRAENDAHFGALSLFGFNKLREEVLWQVTGNVVGFFFSDIF